MFHANLEIRKRRKSACGNDRSLLKSALCSYYAPILCCKIVMPPTENNNCPDGMKSNLRFWVVIHFVLLCLGLSLAHSFVRESVYRNPTSSIEVEGTV